MTDFAALMEEPPGGDNYGREAVSGGWRNLETSEWLTPSPAKRNDLCAAARYHGTEYGYTKMGCRCPICRLAASAARRRRRGIVSDHLGIDPEFLAGSA